MECSHSSSYNFICLTVVMVLASVILIVFLMLVKMAVSSGTINGLIIYANILCPSVEIDDQNCIINLFLHVFVSWISLDLRYRGVLLFRYGCVPEDLVTVCVSLLHLVPGRGHCSCVPLFLHIHS